MGDYDALRRCKECDCDTMHTLTGSGKVICCQECAYEAKEEIEACEASLKEIERIHNTLDYCQWEAKIAFDRFVDKLIENGATPQEVEIRALLMERVLSTFIAGKEPQDAA